MSYDSATQKTGRSTGVEIERKRKILSNLRMTLWNPNVEAGKELSATTSQEACEDFAFLQAK